MGQLQGALGEVVELLPWTPVGRSSTSVLRIGDPAVSGTHAVLAWAGSEWVVQDLASRNGTWLDGLRVGPGLRVPVARGASLAFGDGRVRWRLVDASPPPLRAISEDGGASVVSRSAMLGLPEEEPVALVLRGPEGWVIDVDGEVSAVADGDTVHVGGRAWRLDLPTVLTATVQALPGPQLADLTLCFRVSADEEHVELDAVFPGGRLTAPVRAHHYLLLTLARSRLRDRAEGRGLTEEGWEDVESLARRLGVSNNAFHVQLCRARAQLGELGVVDAGGLIERRVGGRIRVGVERVEIVRLV